MFFLLSPNPQGSAFLLSGSSVLPLFITSLPPLLYFDWILEEEVPSLGLWAALLEKVVLPLLIQWREPFLCEVPSRWKLDSCLFFVFFLSSVERRENQTTTTKLAFRRAVPQSGAVTPDVTSLASHTWITAELWMKVTGFSGFLFLL